MGNEKPQFEKPPLDISTDFLSLEVFAFLEKLRELKEEPSLKIEVDFSNMTEDEKQNFIFKTRRLKAFLEQSTPFPQKRSATVRLREEQKMWEPNVFSSGVKAEIVN